MVFLARWSGPDPREWMDGVLRCVAGTGSDLLDFGLLPALLRLRGASP